MKAKILEPVHEHSVAELWANEENPRTITADRFEDLKKALKADKPMLQARPVIALKNGTVVAGNMRVRAAEALGWKTIPTITVDLDEETARLWLLRDNNAYGEWHEEQLAELLYNLEQQGTDLEMAGFGRRETSRLLDSVSAHTRGGTTAPDDPAPDPPKRPRSKPGEVYELGAHRIMCGDARNKDAVEKLLAGAEPTLIVTDPPYGISLDLGWRGEGTRTDNKEKEPRKRSAAGENNAGDYGKGKKGPGGRPGRNKRGATSMTGDTIADWSEAYELVPSALAIYAWFADVHVAEVVAGLRRLGFELSQFIVWDKMAWALSRAHYHWQHEIAAYAIRAKVEHELPWYGPIAELAVYAKKKGSKVPYLGARDQPTIWQAPSPKRHHKERDLGDEMVDHPTQKPTLLFLRPYTNHTLRGEAVYEPFCGSGTALIAAEMTGRVCYAMEIDPAFVDVSRDRYAAFTGTKA